MPDKIGRNPKAGTRDRRFQDKVRSIMNSFLRKVRIVRTTNGLNDWDLAVGDSADTVLAVEVFSKKPDLPPLQMGPIQIDMQQVLMVQVFTPRISYGQVG